jgi:hypothetical protein
LDVAQIAEVDDDDSNTEVDEVNLAGTPRKMLESVIFGTLFWKMSVVRFLELIAKIGIAKIGIAKIRIAKIGIPIGMDH